MSLLRISDSLPADQFVEAARVDLENDHFVHAAAEITLTHLLPKYALKKPWHFQIFRISDGSFAVDSNLDFDALNREYHKHFSIDHSSMSTFSLLSLTHMPGFFCEPLRR